MAATIISGYAVALFAYCLRKRNEKK
ncbi:type I toxin-antitoxin system Fst family toxin [Mammaliicoccus sciuri]|nr:type I toxin-antitoxin system Fst family toxin [Mammaliicoccus sciuri]